MASSGTSGVHAPEAVRSRGLPLVQRRLQFRRRLFQFRLEAIDLGLGGAAAGLLIRRGEIEPGLVVAGAIPLGLLFVFGAREECQEAEVVLLAERIVLVVVALRAGERRAEPDGCRGVHAIDQHLVQRLLGIDPAFFVGHGVAVEPGRNPLLDGRVGQHVTGDLLDGEPIERHVRG